MPEEKKPSKREQIVVRFPWSDTRAYPGVVIMTRKDGGALWFCPVDISKAT
jgi:hypothetical protein